MVEDLSENLYRVLYGFSDGLNRVAILYGNCSFPSRPCRCMGRVWNRWLPDRLLPHLPFSLCTRNYAAMGGII